ncbi:hypothetical protein [Microbacterium panaciterrae]
MMLLRPMLSAATPAKVVPETVITEAHARRIVAEAQAAYRPDYGWGRSPYGVSTTRLIRTLSAPDSSSTAADVVALGCRVAMEELHSRRPTGTDVGRVLLTHAEELLRPRLRKGLFHESPDATTRRAERRAARLQNDLPAFSALLGTILECSAAALRRTMVDHGCSSVRLFRGVAGTGAPRTLVEASAARYPMRALSSWSTDFESAETFARLPGPGVGVVVEADVPAGCLAIAPGRGEGEVLLFPIALNSRGRAAGFHELQVIEVHTVDR